MLAPQQARQTLSTASARPVWWFATRTPQRTLPTE
jgi:hypothetical protein